MFGAVVVVPKLQRPPGMLSMLAAGIHSLKVLRLVWCKANDAELSAIVVANPHLRELNLEVSAALLDSCGKSKLQLCKERAACSVQPGSWEPMTASISHDNNVCVCVFHSVVLYHCQWYRCQYHW